MPPKRTRRTGAGVVSEIKKIKKALVPLAKIAGKKLIKEKILPAALKKAGLSGEGMKPRRRRRK